MMLASGEVQAWNDPANNVIKTMNEIEQDANSQRNRGYQGIWIKKSWNFSLIEVYIFYDFLPSILLLSNLLFTSILGPIMSTDFAMYDDDLIYWKNVKNKPLDAKKEGHSLD